MASVIKARRPQDPSRLEIEARKAEIQARNGWVAPQVDYIGEANRLLQEHDDEPAEYRDARQVEEWLPVPKTDEPREMTREDIANVALHQKSVGGVSDPEAALRNHNSLW